VLEKFSHLAKKWFLYLMSLMLGCDREQSARLSTIAFTQVISASIIC
jgi:hypothetical protein